MKINRRPDRMLPRTLAILVILCLCDCSVQKDQKETERYILESERQWAESVATGDTSAIERILADDFIGIDPKGQLYTKQQMIDETRNAPKNFVSNRLNDVKVRFYGNTREARLGKNTPANADASSGPTPGCSATAGGKSSPLRT
jgi:Domain of unknown function (DUF4440)